jgi:hypothetical protein
MLLKRRIRYLSEAGQKIRNYESWDCEVHAFLVQVRAAARDRKIHSLYEIKVVYAQKPQ